MFVVLFVVYLFVCMFRWVPVAPVFEPSSWVRVNLFSDVSLSVMSMNSEGHTEWTGLDWAGREM